MKYFLTVAFALFTMLLVAQPKIEFKSLEHDYGIIQEDDGVANTVFEFKNTGDQPLILNNVRATCGCTTPKWTKEPITPGSSGKIEVGYNPKNRPGPFSKSVNVDTNAKPSVSVLKIKGNVAAREKTLEEKYPRAMGPIRLKTNYTSFGSMVQTEKKTEELPFVNTSDAPVKVEVYRSPRHISVEFEPKTLEPGNEGKMLVTYDATLEETFGYSSDRIYLTINGEKNNRYSVGSSVTIKEDFSHLTSEELDNAPQVEFDNKVFDFGTIKEGEKVQHNYKLTNKGKSDLIIRNIRASCGCTAVKHESVVKPGETTDLSVVFNSRGKRNRQNKSITVITNDPKNSTVILRVMGTVKAN
ncbi:MAG: DUF1573 domain-containing protein [Prolixibacteraceae bacterium]|jgi:hypothetical protein|nr:DUF1573 domain-containing protein [Prolixibacteraceae bacterium]